MPISSAAATYCLSSDTDRPCPETEIDVHTAIGQPMPYGVDVTIAVRTTTRTRSSAGRNEQDRHQQRSQNAERDPEPRPVLHALFTTAAHGLTLSRVDATNRTSCTAGGTKRCLSRVISLGKLILWPRRPHRPGAQPRSTPPRSPLGSG
jgi:hypothetical protein